MALPSFVTDNLVPLTPPEPPSTDGAYRWRHWNIAQFCVDIAGTTNGVADPVSKEFMERELRWLKWRIRYWYPSGGCTKTAPIDEAVRQLILATITLLESELTTTP